MDGRKKPARGPAADQGVCPTRAAAQAAALTGETACPTKKSSRRATKSRCWRAGAKAPPGKAAAGKISCPTSAEPMQGLHDCFSLFVNEQAKAYSTKKRHEDSLRGAMNCAECNTNKKRWPLHENRLLRATAISSGGLAVGGDVFGKLVTAGTIRTSDEIEVVRIGRL